MKTSKSQKSLEHYTKIYETHSKNKIKNMKLKTILLFIFTLFFYFLNLKTKNPIFLIVALVLTVLYFLYSKKYVIKSTIVLMLKEKTKHDEEVMKKIEECNKVIKNSGTFYEAQKLYQSAKDYYNENFYNLTVPVNLYVRSQLDKISSDIVSLNLK